MDFFSEIFFIIIFFTFLIEISHWYPIKIGNVVNVSSEIIKLELKCNNKVYREGAGSVALDVRHTIFSFWFGQKIPNNSNSFPFPEGSGREKSDERQLSWKTLTESDNFVIFLIIQKIFISIAPYFAPQRCIVRECMGVCCCIWLQNW